MSSRRRFRRSARGRFRSSSDPVLPGIDRARLWGALCVDPLERIYNNVLRVSHRFDLEFVVDGIHSLEYLSFEECKRALLVTTPHQIDVMKSQNNEYDDFWRKLNYCVLWVVPYPHVVRVTPRTRVLVSYDEATREKNPVNQDDMFMYIYDEEQPHRSTDLRKPSQYDRLYLLRGVPIGGKKTKTLTNNKFEILKRNEHALGEGDDSICAIASIAGLRMISQDSALRLGQLPKFESLLQEITGNNTAREPIINLSDITDEDKKALLYSLYINQRLYNEDKTFFDKITVWDTYVTHGNALKDTPESPIRMPGWSYVEDRPAKVNIFEGENELDPVVANDEQRKLKKIHKIHDTLRIGGAPPDENPHTSKRSRRLLPPEVVPPRPPTPPPSTPPLPPTPPPEVVPSRAPTPPLERHDERRHERRHDERRHDERRRDERRHDERRRFRGLKARDASRRR